MKKWFADLVVSLQEGTRTYYDIAIVALALTITGLMGYMGTIAMLLMVVLAWCLLPKSVSLWKFFKSPNEAIIALQQSSFHPEPPRLMGIAARFEAARQANRQASDLEEFTPEVSSESKSPVRRL